MRFLRLRRFGNEEDRLQNHPKKEDKCLNKLSKLGSFVLSF
jgi:hypothetical protein